MQPSKPGRRSRHGAGGLEERPYGSGAEAPAMQKPFKERLSEIQPYKDIVDQIEWNCHGRGGMRKVKARLRALERGEGPKLPDVTPLDDVADSLASSRCYRHAKASLNTPDDWPAPDPKYPEVAFIGRSNAGKSSMLNKVSRFGTVAKVSATPGETKQAHWYRNRKVGLDVIDLPGYGYTSRGRGFSESVLEFVKERASLVCLYLLLDARNGLTRDDFEWLSELGGAGPPKQIILTKCDLVPKKRLIKLASLVRADLAAFKRTTHKLLLCSSAWNTGMHEIRVDICRRCGKEPVTSEGPSKDDIPFMKRSQVLGSFQRAPDRPPAGEGELRQQRRR